MTLTANEVKAQIQRLLADCPELREDDEALVLSLESETDATELCDLLLENIQLLDAWEAALKSRIDRLKNRIDYLKFRQTRLEQTIISILQAAERKSLPLPHGTPVIRYNQHVVVIEKELVPPEFRRQPPLPEWEVDKKLVGAALKAHQPVPGCALSNLEPSLSIRVK